jgi:hypothetical protein
MFGFGRSGRGGRIKRKHKFNLPSLTTEREGAGGRRRGQESGQKREQRILERGEEYIILHDCFTYDN